MTICQDSLCAFFFFPFQPGAVRRAAIFQAFFIAGFVEATSNKQVRPNNERTQET